MVSTYGIERMGLQNIAKGIFESKEGVNSESAVKELDEYIEWMRVRG